MWVDPTGPDFAEIWCIYSPILARALRYAGGTHKERDLLDAVLARKAQMWINGESAVLSEIAVYPQVKGLRIWLAAGNYEEIREIEQKGLVPFCKAYGLTRIEFIGRKGWAKKLDDYTASLVMMTKEIK